jgi:hypothetical protein
MELLLEEFFRKVLKHSEDSIIFKILVKIMMIILVIALLGLIAWAIIRGQYFLLIILAVFYVIAEIAHAIRKSREKRMLELGNKKQKQKQITKKTVMKKIKKDDMVVDDSLLETEDSENIDLLGEDAKNKELLEFFKTEKKRKVKNKKVVKNKGDVKTKKKMRVP